MAGTFRDNYGHSPVRHLWLVRYGASVDVMQSYVADILGDIYGGNGHFCGRPSGCLYYMGHLWMSLLGISVAVNL